MFVSSCEPSEEPPAKRRRVSVEILEDEHAEDETGPLPGRGGDASFSRDAFPKFAKPPVPAPEWPPKTPTISKAPKARPQTAAKGIVKAMPAAVSDEPAAATVDDEEPPQQARPVDKGGKGTAKLKGKGQGSLLPLPPPTPPHDKGTRTGCSAKGQQR